MNRLTLIIVLIIILIIFNMCMGSGSSEEQFSTPSTLNCNDKYSDMNQPGICPENCPNWVFTFAGPENTQLWRCGK
jgi:hypothetical protein